MQVTYHSHHGAVQESMHVFIEAGLRWTINHAAGMPPSMRVFEMGFGTGLNALLTALEAEKLQLPFQYTAVEKFPLTADEAAGLNYGGENKALFQSLHAAAWNEQVVINPFFTLEKVEGALESFTATAPYHLIYFDAFAPAAQPELWTEEIFSRLYGMLHPGGVLVTYCSKGVVRRAMQAAGFTVTKTPGPPGKREMVRAVRSF